MTERKPDLVVQDQLCKSIYIIEMAVSTDSNINGRWQEKFQKYQKLAADMRKQFMGYRIKVVPMTIGAFGTVETLLKDLWGIPKLSKSAVELMRAMQRTVLWTMSSPVPVLACRPLETVVDWCMEVLPPLMTVNFGPTCTCLLLLEGDKARASG